MLCAHEIAGRATRERSRAARKTSGIVANGEVVWSWHPLLVSSRAEAHSAQPGYEMPSNPRGDGGKRNSSPGRSRISRKTIAWGMPDVFRCLRCEYSCAYFTTQRARGCGCIGAPGIPRALFFKGRNMSGKARARCVGRERGYVPAFLRWPIRDASRSATLLGMRSSLAAWRQTLMLRRRASRAVSGRCFASLGEPCGPRRGSLRWGSEFSTCGRCLFGPTRLWQRLRAAAKTPPP